MHYRTIANIAMDYAWFSQDLDHPEDWRVEIADKLQHFFCHTVRHRTDGIYELDGTDNCQAKRCTQWPSLPPIPMHHWLPKAHIGKSVQENSGTHR